MNYEICVIGSKALLFPFLQFGFSTYTPQSETALREYLREALQKNIGIIYIEDSYCFMVRDILDKYRNSLTPIFVPIGESEEGESFSKLMVREMMEKAVGNVNLNVER
jgi:vacuolar-type H+-ATPase subunit F/Vma7